METIGKANLKPVLLTLDGVGLTVRAIRVGIADWAWEVGTDRLEVLIPVWPIDSIDAEILERKDSFISVPLCPVGCTKDEARGHVDDFVNVVSVE